MSRFKCNRLWHVEFICSGRELERAVSTCFCSLLWKTSVEFHLFLCMSQILPTRSFFSYRLSFLPVSSLNVYIHEQINIDTKGKMESENKGRHIYLDVLTLNDPFKMCFFVFHSVIPPAFPPFHSIPINVLLTHVHTQKKNTFTFPSRWFTGQFIPDCPC